jgi:hypothetical protein
MWWWCVINKNNHGHLTNSYDNAMATSPSLQTQHQPQADAKHRVGFIGSKNLPTSTWQAHPSIFHHQRFSRFLGLRLLISTVAK